MAKLNTTGGAPNKDTSIDGDFRRACLREGGYIPTAANDANGKVGEYSFDDSYIYVKISATAWKRAAISTW